ncbi:hypothetical protein D3C75_964150 [compost metagenome]
MVGHFRQPILPGTDNLLGEAFLAFDQFVDPFLQRALANQLMHLHILMLADTESPVCRLILNGRIPPAVIMHHMIGPCKVQPDPPGFE